MGNIVAGSSTIFLIPKVQVPQDGKLTYVIIVCDIKSRKYETLRTRLTVGRNIIDYPGEFITPT